MLKLTLLVLWFLSYPACLAWSVTPPENRAGKNALLYATGTLGGVAVSDSRFANGDVFIYLPGADLANGNGSLKKIVLSINDDGQVHLAEKAQWDAADLLGAGNAQAGVVSPDMRKIYTFRMAAGYASGTVEFNWENLTEQQKAWLNLSPLTRIADGLGSRRVNFLRGMRSDEITQPQGMFRARVNVLGSMANSKPVYVTAPAPGNHDAAYQAFSHKYKNRMPAVYMGAHGGMLHSFCASEGRELFAYIPNAIYSQLNQLTRPDYQPRSYMDGAIAVAEAQMLGNWRTILAAGMGRGAQGVFALDVTEPENFTRGMGALWEFTQQDDPDMGYVLNVPVIAKFKTGVKKGASQYRYFVAVGTGADHVSGYDQGAGMLFLLALDKAPGEQWKLGSNYFKFKTPDSDGKPSGMLSAPVFVIGDDAAVEYAYAGDLLGNLWRFTFTGHPPWKKDNAAMAPLFTATDSKGVRQPITIQPQVVFAPMGGFLVLFGTGRIAEEDFNPPGFRQQSFYGIYDTPARTYQVAGRHQLEPRAFSMTANGGMQLYGQDFSFGTSAGRRKGWYIDFWESDKTGERSVTNPVVASGQVFFTSLIPCSIPCAQGGGYSYALNALTGKPSDAGDAAWVAELGMLKSPVLLEAGRKNGNRTPIGNALSKRNYVVLQVGTGGRKGILAVSQDGNRTKTVTATVTTRRLSWREVLNWQESRFASSRK